ncbi:MAG: SDR family oxidoreductase [Lactobacillus sp.]|nr:SDR family oxidoreductase [Lactobacillus sp.]
MTGYKQLKDLTNRVVLITGASSGLGEQVAYQAAKKGAIVVGCARRKDKLEKVMAVCRAISGRLAYAYHLDVSQPAEIEKVIDEIETNVGPIDVLINDAGFGMMKQALNFNMDIAESMFRVNVLGLMYVTKYTALNMAKRRRGMIINVASIAGKIATPKASVYSATKAAVIAYSNSLRLELKPLGITVMTVNPGPIRTAFFDIADETGDYINSVKWMALNPEIVAEKIVKAIGTNKRELNLPSYMEWAHHGYQVFPRLGDYLAGGIFNKK